MKTVAIVPMKLNNYRLPQKSTKSFTHGKPLCYYILSTLLTVKEVEEVYVYCSNPDIKEFIPVGVKYIKRSESLDQDSTEMNETLQSFAFDVPADIYVMTHTTAPFISRESIEKELKAIPTEAILLYLARKKILIVTTSSLILYLKWFGLKGMMILFDRMYEESIKKVHAISQYHLNSLRNIVGNMQMAAVK